MTFNKSVFTVLFIFLFSITGVAQEKEKQSLQKILMVLEQRYDVTFTYADDNIAGLFLSTPSEKFTLVETLRYLEQNTGLLFQQLNDSLVTISKAKENSKDICGVVTDSDTGESVTGAIIQSGNDYSISDESGSFILKSVSENSVIQLRFVGYKTIDVPVKEFLNIPCKKIALELQFTSLQEIYISDFPTQGIDKKVDGSIVIRAKTLGILPGLTEPDVLQTIQALPGIQSIHETISDINVRGGTNDQNLVLWDGIKMYHSGHFFGLISAYNPYLTEKVALIKNGSEAALGDGVSSTIDIRTDDDLAEIFSAGAGINMINGDAFAKVPLTEKISLQISGRRSVADSWVTPAFKQYFQRAFRNTDVTKSQGSDTLVSKNENFYFYDASLKLLYDISEKDKLRLSFLNVFNDIEYNENALINNTIESRTSGLEQQNFGSGVSYSRLWSEKLRTSAQVFLSSYKLGAVNFDLLNDQRLIQENKVLDSGLKLDSRVSLTNNIDLFGGYQFFETGISNLEDINNPPFKRLIKKVLRTHAAFLEGNFSFSQTDMRLGIRTNYFPSFKELIIEPRLSFNQNFLKYFFFEILGEMKNQTTAQIIDLQNDFLGVEKRRWVLSNDNDIPIIRSKQVSMGIYYKKNNFLASIEAYYKGVEGIITSSQGFQNQFEFIRSDGNFETVGVDFLISNKLDHLTTWLSYSNADNTYEFKQLIPPFFPNNLDVTHRITLGSAYERNHFELSSGLNWHTGKPFTEPVEMNQIVNNIINYGAPNSSRLKDYFRIDFSARYRFPISSKVRGQAGVSIWNILNQENIINQYFSINNNQLESVQQSSLGFTTNVIFRINF